MSVLWMDPAYVDPGLDSRAATFENPSGARGAGGSARRGRKGAPAKRLDPGERVVLLDARGPGAVRHIWMTFPPAAPEVMRAMWMEVFYDGAAEPSVSVPCLDFFGLPHGRPAAYASLLTTAQEGKGLNSFIPMPFARAIRIELTNGSTVPREVFYQVDYTLGAVEPSYLHVSFRRENPTTPMRDFAIADGLRGPGRFLGCVVGVRVIDEGLWYGEGEVKVYRDGDRELPTICGTGLEDYVGSAWGLGSHHAPFAGAPVDVRPEGADTPDFVGFYRWHVADPIMFATDLRVTIQQIGYTMFENHEAFDRFAATHPAAGDGWIRPDEGPCVAHGIYERVDDYCSAAFVYCATPQPVRRPDVSEALAGIERRPYESPSADEILMNALTT